MKQNRLMWIDFCKAIAILLMVLGHVGVGNNTNIFIHAFHMPLFFILSGYCFNDKKYVSIKEFAKKRFLSLIVPYLIFGIALFFVWNGSLFILHRTDEMKPIVSLINSLLWVNTTASTFSVVQWFLTCLFFVEVLFFIICKLSKRNSIKIGITITILSMISFLLSVFCNFRLPLAFDTALMAVLFYGIGWIIKEKDIFNKIAIEKKKNKFIALGVAILLITISIPTTLLNGEVNMRSLHFSNYILFVFNALAFSYAIMLLTILWEKVIKINFVNIITQWIGKNTLVVLLLNYTLIRIWQIAIEKITTLKNIPNWIVAIFITIICAGISEVINRYFPILLGKRKEKNYNE